MKRSFTYPHEIECAIRALAHGSNATRKLARFLIEQQKPDWNRQKHLFREAQAEIKRAARWTKIARQRPTR